MENGSKIVQTVVYEGEPSGKSTAKTESALAVFTVQVFRRGEWKE